MNFLLKIILFNVEALDSTFNIDDIYILVKQQNNLYFNEYKGYVAYNINYVYYETNYYHPQFNIETVEAQKEIEKIQGVNNIWYTGAWLGNGFHEDGFSSAINISNKFNSLPEWLRQY